MPRGVHRIRDGWANQHSVLVRYEGGKELEMPQDRYEASGFDPPFEELPWKEE